MERKLTDLEKLQLLTVYTAGFRLEAQLMALEFGVSRYYATVLYERMFKPPPTRPIAKKWLRSIELGKVSV